MLRVVVLLIIFASSATSQDFSDSAPSASTVTANRHAPSEDPSGPAASASSSSGDSSSRSISNSEAGTLASSISGAGEIEALNQRLMQLEEMAFSSSFRAEAEAADGEEERSLLEVFGDATSQWLVNHLAPATDPEVSC